MLVFKRALNLLLCALLAFSPTLAYARPQTKTAKAKAKLTHFQAKAQKLPKVNALPLMTGGEAFRAYFPVVHTKSGDYNVTTEPGLNGRVKSQIVRGKGYEEILLDEFGTGTASYWQRTVGNKKYIATNPYRGRFTKLEVEDRRTGSIIKSTYYWNTQLQTYRVSTIDVQPYRVDAYKMNAIATTAELCAAKSTLADDIHALDEFLKKLSESMKRPADQALACKLRRYQDLFVDPSCQNSQFGSSIDAMLEGLAKTIVSPPDGARNSFLRCAEDHGFAVNSARVKGFFMKNQNAIEDALKSITAGETDYYNDRCDRVETVTPYGKPPVKTASLVSFPKMIKCDPNIKEPAEWDDQNLQIKIKVPASTVTGVTRFATRSTADAYAAIITHELLHQSGLPEQEGEETVQAIESCCAYPKNEVQFVRSACSTVDQIASAHRASQAMETILSGTPGYTKAVQQIRNTLHFDGAGDFIEKWQEGFATDKPTAEAITRLEICYNSAGNDSSKQEKCAANASAQFTKYTRNYVNSKCPHYAAIENVQNAAASCAAISTQLTSLVQLNSTVAATPQGQVTISANGIGTSVKLAVPIMDVLNKALDAGLVAQVQAGESKVAAPSKAPAESTFNTIFGQIARPDNSGRITGANGSKSGYNPTVGTGNTPDPLPQNPAAPIASDPPPASVAPQAPKLAAGKSAGAKPPQQQTKTQPASQPPTTEPDPRALTTPRVIAGGNVARNTTGTTGGSNIAISNRNGAFLANQQPPSNQQPSDNLPPADTSDSSSNAPVAANTQPPDILNLPRASSIQMPKMLGVSGPNRTDGINNLRPADSQALNLAQDTLSKASTIIGSAVVTPANAQTLRLPASDGSTVTSSGSNSNSSSSADKGSARSNSYSGGGGGGGGSSVAPPSASFASVSKAKATVDQPEKKNSGEKNAATSLDPLAAAPSGQATQNAGGRSMLVDDPDVAKINKSQIGQLFPHGTNLDNEFLAISGARYDSWNAKLADPTALKNLAELLAARGRQILWRGTPIGSPHPINCWRADAKTKHFIRLSKTDCGSK